MKPRDLNYFILRPMLRGALAAIGIVAAAAVIPLVWALGIAIGG